MAEFTMNALEEIRMPIAHGDTDVLRELVKQMAEALMGAEAEVLCGAPYGERHAERAKLDALGVCAAG